MKRVFGQAEAIFNILYLLSAAVIGLVLLAGSTGNTERLTAGIMALVLAGGDAFHLIPRVAFICSGDEEKYRVPLGVGKQITSITMTVFYLLLWQLGMERFDPVGAAPWTVAFWALAFIRIALCFFPQNRWTDRFPPVSWGIIRNIPFFVIGMLASGLYLCCDAGRFMWLAILLSFAFYLPVVLWSNSHPKLGMLMLPKTCAYLWMLVLCLAL